jgi:thioredoxin-related protein
LEPQTPAKSQAQQLPIPASLPVAARAAAQRGEPLVVLVSLPGCPWCELLRRNYLVPMRSETRPVAAVEVVINDRQRAITDFDGRASHGQAISDRYRARITPTVLFLGPEGQELAPRIEGVASAELIGSVLDERLETARQRLQR